MHFDTASRQRWMRVLAHSQPAALQARMNALNLAPDYETLRAPEIGLVQIQARMGGTGDRFFTGDATLHPRRYSSEQRHAGLRLRSRTR
ncbi:phosphonate C-P lyase system protein PhnG [Enterobacter cancerogenus]|uniref:Phosphonate C-P lyase system protein PhnG n=1 Tax=Enterobacter cancerogenus TaxID=69218 RepID=A0A484XV31_9ENTR|nr:phosphonate C-P lyase system protein PhnG [Enterobacter cancerogenus]